MRISDWSSDVCSSDLVPVGRGSRHGDRARDSRSDRRRRSARSPQAASRAIQGPETDTCRLCAPAKPRRQGLNEGPHQPVRPSMSTARGHIIRRLGQLRSREVRATEAVTLALSRAHDDPCNAFVTLTDEYALRRAVHIDALLDADRDPGPLAGVMVGVKDVHDVAGINTYHGSRAFAGAPTAPSSSPLVQGLEDAGVIRSEEHTSELQSLMRISYAVFCLKKKKK